jgi:hypothetical protein
MWHGYQARGVMPSVVSLRTRHLADTAATHLGCCRLDFKVQAHAASSTYPASATSRATMASSRNALQRPFPGRGEPD